MSSSMAVFQNAFYIGNNFNAILYGMVLVLYFKTIRTMIRSRHKQARSDRFFFVFSTALVCLNTIFVATEAVFGQEMWVVHADYPGGQDAYLNDYAAVWYQTLGTAASIVLNLLSDGLMIYRCWIVWGNIYIVAFPILLYLGAFSVGIVQLIASGIPGSNYFQGVAHNLGVAYTSSVISLNVIVTSLMCVRIYRAGRRIAGLVGAEVGRDYVTATAIIVESALLYTVTGVAYLVAFATQSQTSVFFLSLYVMMTCIAPQMIILRVITGRGWTRDRSAMTGTDLEFTKTAHATTTGHIEFSGESVEKHMELVITETRSSPSGSEVDIADAV
ncbi:hypothetical protein BD413DRAFT_314484 [Trametes elegans]|nr:hypothetical protein BD413DRAFT_314484 [Trametes elegans]